LRAAICDLIGDFGSRYPSGEEFLRRLDAIDQQMASDADAARAAFEQLQRAALIANPLVQAQPILFVVREQYLPDHHNTETIFHTGEPNNRSYRPGGPLKILDPATGRTSVLLEPGPEGLIRDPEVHFDGRKIVFSMRKARDENYSIYELQVDPQQGWAAVPGSLRRLTANRTRRTSTRSICRTARSCSPARASRNTAIATCTSWRTCTAWTATARTSTRSARARCSRATPA
jgi:hypothetical protein